MHCCGRQKTDGEFHVCLKCMTFLPQVHHKSLSLGEVLDGDRMAESLYHIQFREPVEKKVLCQLTLSEKQVHFQSYFQQKGNEVKY